MKEETCAMKEYDAGRAGQKRCPASGDKEKERDWALSSGKKSRGYGLYGLGLWKDVVENEIDNDTCDGDVHPEWPGPADYGFVLSPIFFEGEPEGSEDEWDNGDSQKNMSCQQSEIKRLEPQRLREDGMTGKEVIDEVASEKDSRCDESRNHAFLMSGFILYLNKVVSQQEEDGTDGIEAGIDSWQRFDIHRQ